MRWPGLERGHCQYGHYLDSRCQPKPVELNCVFSSTMLFLRGAGKGSILDSGKWCNDSRGAFV